MGLSRSPLQCKRLFREKNYFVNSLASDHRQPRKHPKDQEFLMTDTSSAMCRQNVSEYGRCKCIRKRQKRLQPVSLGLIQSPGHKPLMYQKLLQLGLCLLQIPHCNFLPLGNWSYCCQGVFLPTFTHASQNRCSVECHLRQAGQPLKIIELAENFMVK